MNSNCKRVQFSTSNNFPSFLYRFRFFYPQLRAVEYINLVTWSERSAHKGLSQKRAAGRPLSLGSLAHHVVEKLWPSLLRSLFSWFSRARVSARATVLLIKYPPWSLAGWKAGLAGAGWNFMGCKLRHRHFSLCVAAAKGHRPEREGDIWAELQFCSITHIKEKSGDTRP